jgi:site-specific DNA-cytosine methylase
MNALVGFAGFGGVEIALRDFGIDSVGIEVNPAIAEVNRRNGGHCLTADLLAIDPTDYVGWLLFHFSPPCPNFSLAKVGGSEQESDLLLARKICEFIRVGRPVYFTLENVWSYRKSLSWHLIQYTLLEEDYGLDAWHLNAADYGVPQTRRRMIAIARRDGRQPTKPWPTHSKNGDMFTLPWRGWYEAIEDLIPALEESKLASWQKDRLPESLGDFLIMTGNTNRGGIDNKPGRGWLNKKQPANAVTTVSGGGMPKAVLINSQNARKGCRLTIRESDKPTFTVVANMMEKNSPPKVFVIGGQFQTPQNGKSRIVQNKTANEPIWTICTSDKLDTRVYQAGKIISVNTRCLARFQDFPDNFILPDNRQLACRGIGNALPPGVYRAVLRSLDL